MEQQWYVMDWQEKAVLIFLMLSVGLSALGKMLDLIKDKTSSAKDNKAAELLNKLAGWMQKIVDWLSANRQHK
jgi:hypothetical protein